MVLFIISEVMFFLRSFILVYYRLLALGDVGALLIRAKKHTLVALILTIILAFLFTVYWWRGKYIMKKIFNENENQSKERAPKIYRQKGPILTDLNDEEYKLRLETLIADLEMKEQLKIEKPITQIKKRHTNSLTTTQNLQTKRTNPNRS